jgi:hypothetical protein
VSYFDRAKYTEAIGRNPGEEAQHSHLYAILPDHDYMPMCRYGWNRSDGEGFSIFRGHSGARGLCRTCQKRAAANLPPVPGVPGSHKTKWL